MAVATLFLQLQPRDSCGLDPHILTSAGLGSQDFMPPMKVLRRSHAALRGCVADDATTLTEARSPCGPPAIFLAATKCFFQTRNSVL